ncbi:hypothetical protein HDE_07876 [Halotydeus destructor]|nr:hypothetical protein HDE_07876 [Halotydeus destructor]
MSAPFFFSADEFRGAGKTAGQFTPPFGPTYSTRFEGSSEEQQRDLINMEKEMHDKMDMVDDDDLPWAVHDNTIRGRLRSAVV